MCCSLLFSTVLVCIPSRSCLGMFSWVSRHMPLTYTSIGHYQHKNYKVMHTQLAPSGRRIRMNSINICSNCWIKVGHLNSWIDSYSNH